MGEENNYISYEEIIKANTLFAIYDVDGNFYICMDDYKCSEAQKKWYKLSLNPYDLDFLKFRFVGKGYITRSSIGSYGKSSRIYRMLNYLGVFKNNEFCRYNSNILRNIYFGTSNKRSLKDRAKGISNHSNRDWLYGGEVNYSKIYRIKQVFTNKIKIWLKRLYKFYNQFDNSLEYIHEYYNRWVLLVNFTYKELSCNTRDYIWKFIEHYKVSSLDDFMFKINSMDYLRNVSRKDLRFIKDRSIEIFSNLDLNYEE